MGSGSSADGLWREAAVRATAFSGIFRIPPSPSRFALHLTEPDEQPGPESSRAAAPRRAPAGPPRLTPSLHLRETQPSAGAGPDSGAGPRRALHRLPRLQAAARDFRSWPAKRCQSRRVCHSAGWRWRRWDCGSGSPLNRLEAAISGGFYFPPPNTRPAGISGAYTASWNPSATANTSSPSFTACSPGSIGRW